MSRLEKVKEHRRTNYYWEDSTEIADRISNDIDWLIEKLEKCEEYLIFLSAGFLLNNNQPEANKQAEELLKSIREGK